MAVLTNSSEFPMLVDSKYVCELLGITPNNLYQMRYRKQLVWVKKEGKRAFYLLEDVQNFQAKRRLR